MFNIYINSTEKKIEHINIILILWFMSWWRRKYVCSVECRYNIGNRRIYKKSINHVALDTHHLALICDVCILLHFFHLLNSKIKIYMDWNIRENGKS